MSLTRFGVSSRTEAKNKAREMAHRFAELQQPPSKPLLTIDRLITFYLEEVTPTKGESKRAHDLRAAKVFRAFFDGRCQPKGQTSRLACSLNAADWNEFIADRKSGRIPDGQPLGTDRLSMT
jgi:hypothetical protein